MNFRYIAQKNSTISMNLHCSANAIYGPLVPRQIVFYVPTSARNSVLNLRLRARVHDVCKIYFSENFGMEASAKAAAGLSLICSGFLPPPTGSLPTDAFIPKYSEFSEKRVRHTMLVHGVVDW